VRDFVILSTNWRCTAEKLLKLGAYASLTYLAYILAQRQQRNGLTFRCNNAGLSRSPAFWRAARTADHCLGYPTRPIGAITSNQLQAPR
jgi:hypothetical protein